MSGQGNSHSRQGLEPPRFENIRICPKFCLGHTARHSEHGFFGFCAGQIDLVIRRDASLPRAAGAKDGGGGSLPF